MRAEKNRRLLRASNTFPLLLFLSCGSGIAALIYEIVWFQLLELIVGSTAVSLGFLLAAFMGGMCLGSWLLPRTVSARRNPLRVYAALELGIGACGIGVWLLTPHIAGTAAAVAILIPPTLLMGATLPVLARCTSEAIDLGWLYGANIGGAVFGSLLAGFYLLRVHDVAVATYAAAGINASMAAVAVVIAGFVSTPERAEKSPTDAPPSSNPVLFAIALSGFTALAAESLWTRTLGLLFGASVYSLSIILAVFLGGLGIGSVFGSRICRHSTNARQSLAVCQFLLMAAIAWTSYTLTASLPYWPIDPTLFSNIWFTFELDIARALWAVLPPAILWGASFPLALAALTPDVDNAAVMSRAYAANTLGAIAGALATTLLLIPSIGSQRSAQGLIAISAVGGLIVLEGDRRRRLIQGLGAVALGAALINAIPPLSPLLVAYGRYAASWEGQSDIIYAAEGRNSSIAVARFSNGTLTFNVAGKVQASNVPRDMRLQRMLGHLTTLTVDHPRSVLVIGCGAGITAGAVSIDPRVESETIAEIEPLVPHAASIYFSEPNFEVLHNPKVRLHLDDGRHYLLTTQERFDGITVDPLDPWVAGAANLYTKEFYEAMKRRLNPGGSVTMYIQLFETTPEAVKSAVATFLDVFPNGTLWGNTYNGRGHDMILLGQVEPLHLDLDTLDQRFGYQDQSNMIPGSLAEVGINSPEELFAHYAGNKADLEEWLRGAPLNRDRNLRMQYLAGLGLDRDDAAQIYAAILSRRRFPVDIFTSTTGRLQSLRLAFDSQGP